MTYVSGQAHSPLLPAGRAIGYDRLSRKPGGRESHVPLILEKNAKLQKTAPPRAVRRSLAALCIFIGVAGCILPIIPGLPFFVVAARLLGPRDRLLRRAILLVGQILRHLRRARQPLLRRLGLRLAPHWRTLTRLMLGSR